MSVQPNPYPNRFETAEAVDADGRPIVGDPTVATPVEAVAEPVVGAPVAAVAEPALAAPVAAVTPAPVAERVVVQPAPAAHETVATSYGRRYAFDSVVVGVVGLAFLLIGLIAMTRAGFDGSMQDPVVEVLGFTHTATLGIIEAGIGLCLLLCAASKSRGASVFFGLVLGVAGFVGAVQVDSFRDSLALETGLAWLAVVAGAVVVVASLLIPRMVTRTDRVAAV
ncbi:MAG TPA: hypothetical protein VHQ23_01470 [Ilumatobacteraceae bacterium]|jgi:hypothetical protein|nr:hypothetical protein [Ilumatobacteraceae bacterium]